MSGGLLALLQHPQQMADLRADEALLSKSVEEMIRWTTPTRCFLRTAAIDYEMRGRSIAAGDRVLLSYASANFDEAQFTEPERFDIARWPNKHIAFGFGTHFCLGGQLARIEMRCLFRELLARTSHIELTGPADLKPTVFVGGVKRLPVRCRSA
jgi:cytochrome P450